MPNQKSVFPVVNNLAREFTRYFSRNDEEDMERLKFLIEIYNAVGGMGVTINTELPEVRNEIIYELFSKKSNKEKRQHEDICKQIVKDPYTTLLMEIIRFNQKATIRIYCYKERTNTLNITYIPEQERFEVSKYWSTDRTSLSTNEEDNDDFLAGEY
jgi:hypothetical protein